MTPTHLSRAKEILVKLMNEADSTETGTYWYREMHDELCIQYKVTYGLYAYDLGYDLEPETRGRNSVSVESVTWYGDTSEEATRDELSALEKEVNEMW